MDQLTVINKPLTCNFCGIKKNDCIRYGPMYRLRNIRAHYFCVLLSNQLQQNGKDNEGVLGFLLSDIQRELRRTINMFCVYCEKGNATITCCNRKCRKRFHLPCGLRNGSLHQFMNDFKSYCRKHRPPQIIPRGILSKIPKNKAICCICYDELNVMDKENVLWAPCCLKTWYHRYCVQKLAHNAGYFFRCATCNDVRKFKNWMERFGIFIPQQDASWELVPNAFEELLFKYDRCDAQNCKCPDGRQKNCENTMWEIVLCESCGSQGMHIACGNLKFLEPQWECPACEEVTKNMKTSATEAGNSIKGDEDSSVVLKLTEVSQKKRRRGSEDLENSVLDKRKRCRTNLVEEDAEVDVETVEDNPKEKNTQTEGKSENDCEVIKMGRAEGRIRGNTNIEEVLTSLKPGPMSYKLSVIREALRLHWNHPVKRNETDRKASENIDLVDLCDSDGVESDDEEIQVVGEDHKSSAQKYFRVKNVKVSEKDSSVVKESSDKVINISSRSSDIISSIFIENSQDDVMILKDSITTGSRGENDREAIELID